MNDDTCFCMDVIDEIAEDELDALLDDSKPFLNTSEKISETSLDKEFDEFMSENVQKDEIKDDFEELPPKDELRIRTSIQDPPTDLELKPLPKHLEYAFLEENSLLPVVISALLKHNEKERLVSVLKNHNEAFAWKTSDILRISPSCCKHKINFEDDVKPVIQRQRRLNPNMKEVVKKEIIKLLDADIIYAIEESPWDMLENSMEVLMDDFSCHYMVTEGIVLGHKVSRKGLEVDKAKIDVIAKLPPPTNVKSVRNFDIEIKNKKGAENVAADHLLRLEKTNLKGLKDEEINDVFPDKFLMNIKTDEEKSPWFADFANYLDEPYLFKACPDGMIRRCVHGSKSQKILDECHHGPTRGHYGPSITANKVFDAGFYSPTVFKEAQTLVQNCDACQHSGSISRRNEMPLNIIQVSEIFNIWGIDFMGPFSKSHKFEYILVVIDYVYKWAEAEALPTNDARVVVNILKKFFSHFGILKPLISDRGTYFCNCQMEKISKKYGVHQRIATAYHPQTSGQVENTNRALKRILEKTVKDNPSVWSRKLYDALWAFRTAYKTPIGEKRFLQLHELDELRLQAYENSKLYKARTKAYHDKKLRVRKEFKAEDKVLLYNSKYKFKAPKLRSKCKDGRMKAIPFMSPFLANYLDTMSWVSEKWYIYSMVENTCNEAKLSDIDETGKGISLAGSDALSSSSTTAMHGHLDASVSNIVSPILPGTSTIIPSLTFLAPQYKCSRDKHIELVNIVGNPGAGMLTRAMTKELSVASAHECLFVEFLSEKEPKKVWTLVPPPYGKSIIGSKLSFRNKMDDTVARLEEIRILLAFVTYMNFAVYKIYVKSAFLNGKLKKEVYVQQPSGFKSSEFPNHVCKLDKALYGFKQIPRAWCETLLTFFTEHKFVKGRIENTLFIKQYERGISINQENYVKDLLKKYDINGASVKTPMIPPNNLGPDLNGKSVNENQYRGIIGSPMYLTTSRRNKKFSTCLCARYQASPKESHLIAIMRIFRHLKGTPSLGLWYPKCSGFDLE
ncbi:reverse transcriptase domain-containing protein [Tanacetum coccineum]